MEQQEEKASIDLRRAIETNPDLQGAIMHNKRENSPSDRTQKKLANKWV